VSEFESTSLKDFLFIKLLDRPYYLFGWRFALNRYALQPGDGIPRGFWVDRSDEHRGGRVDFYLHWVIVSRWPHSEKRKTKWRERFKAVEPT